MFHLPDVDDPQKIHHVTPQQSQSQHQLFNNVFFLPMFDFSYKCFHDFWAIFVNYVKILTKQHILCV